MAYYIVHHYCKHRKETIFSEKTKGILLYFNHVFFQMATFFKTGVYIIIYAYVQDLSHWLRHFANPTLLLKLSLKKTAKGTIFSPLKFWEKTKKEAHTKSFISVQKLQAKTERGKYILSIR